MLKFYRRLRKIKTQEIKKPLPNEEKAPEGFEYETVVERIPDKNTPVTEYIVDKTKLAPIPTTEEEVRPKPTKPVEFNKAIETMETTTVTTVKKTFVETT